MAVKVDSGIDYIVEVENLTKVFHDFWGRPKARAVNGVNLSISPGQVFGLLGPNGSGKSTTVKLILGLLYPTRGRIRVLGRSPRNVEVKRRIGYQPEESYLYPYLTSAETLDFFGSLLGIHEEERRRRIEQLLEMVGLARAGKRTVGEFSKGMARRLALAQALINDPDLVVLDEPTAGMDPIACREIKDVIRVLAERGKTVLLCSHLLSDVEDVCDSVVVLYGGRVCAEGPVREVLKVKDQTRIISPSLPDAVLEKIAALITAENVSVDELLIDHPRISLEQFFLDVVRRAQVDHVETSGAQAGAGIAEFLDLSRDGRDEGPARQVLTQLRAPEKPAESEEQESGRDEEIRTKAAGKKEFLRTLSAADNAGKEPVSEEAEAMDSDQTAAAETAEEKQRSSARLRSLLNGSGDNQA